MAEIREQEPASVLGIDYIEIYVSNTLQASHFYRSVLGFQATEIPETIKPSCHESSIALTCGDTRFVLTAPLSPSSAVAEHIRVHGEGVKDVALAVDNVDEFFRAATQLGARGIVSPETQEFPAGHLRTARIGVMGDMVHSLVDRTKMGSPLTSASGQRKSAGTLETSLTGIDHVALALNTGELDRWATFYVGALGFVETHQEDVSTEHSAMRSKVVQSANSRVRFPMMEPAVGIRKSQIENYIECHHGPGTQHLAFLSSDIASSVSALASAGVEFLPTPDAYYHRLEARVGRLTELETLKKFGILADRDKSGMLLQIFTKPIGSRATLFVEIVERRGAEGFGSGNIRALFEAVERTNRVGASA